MVRVYNDRTIFMTFIAHDWLKTEYSSEFLFFVVTITKRQPGFTATIRQLPTDAHSVSAVICSTNLGSIQVLC